MIPAAVVVKVGGSLFDLPGLRRHLRTWLGGRDTARVLLVPGGGLTADAVRALDRAQRLGEETAHWLALRAMTLNAHFLAGLLGAADVVGELEAAEGGWRQGRVPVLDGYAFARADEARPDHLPYSWDVSSDSIAARAAVVARAQRLVLLKSVTVPAGTGWQESARQGWVDGHFARVAGGGLNVECVNFREWVRRR